MGEPDDAVDFGAVIDMVVFGPLTVRVIVWVDDSMWVIVPMVTVPGDDVTSGWAVVERPTSAQAHAQNSHDSAERRDVTPRVSRTTSRSAAPATVT